MDQFLGNRIKNRREELGLTQDELARLVQTFVDHVEVAEDVVTVFYNSTDKKPQPSVRLRPD